MLWLLISLFILSISSCKGKKDAAKLPSDEIKEQVAVFAPLPSFKELFRQADDSWDKELADNLPKTSYQVQKEGPYNAFALGVVIADCYLAIKAKNQVQLSRAADTMIELTNLIGLEESFKTKDQSLKNLIKQKKWDELEKALDIWKKLVEDKLWEKQDYDAYTLNVLGAWTQAMNNVLKLLLKETKDTKAINQEGAWTLMADNFVLISDPQIKDSATHKEVASLINQIRDALKNHQNNTYTKAQLEELIKLTEQIKNMIASS